jgi:hypothetical protein
MDRRRFYRGVFFVAAAYDLVLGVGFLFLYPWVYQLMGISLPTEPAYLQMSAAFVLVQGIMYALVFRNMERNRDLILVGVIYKAAYAGISLYHLALGDLPHVLFAVFGVLDIGFMILFLMCLRWLEAERPLAQEPVRF